MSGVMKMGEPGQTLTHSYTHANELCVIVKQTKIQVVVSTELELISFAFIWGTLLDAPCRSRSRCRSHLCWALAGLFYNLFTLFPWGQIKNEEILITACQGFAFVHTIGQAAP